MELAGLNPQTKLYYGTIYVKNAIYSVDKYWAPVINSASAYGRPSIAMIKIQINELLKEEKRSFYWLAKETGISHTTLWRLKKGKAQGITFDTLEKISQTLKCQPGDVLKIGRNNSNKNNASKKRR